ncbi:MAG: FecR domain-containing protein [Pseudomonadota bacterium]
MSDPDGLDPEEFKRAEEAVRIFRRLNANPDDAQAQKERDAFLARGPEERDTYERLLKGVKLASHVLSPKPKSPPKVTIILVLVLAGLIYALYQPLSIRLQADQITHYQPETRELSSGDIIVLDASTAIADQSDDEARQVRLFEGAVFFDVATEERPFVVAANGVQVQVIGTEFEVAREGRIVSVAVAEGEVEVRSEGRIWQLLSGDHLLLSGDGEPVVSERPIETIAGWRQDFIITDGMTTSEVAEIIDRRIPGPVVVIGGDLSKTELGGRLDLSDPFGALEALATISGGQVRSASPLVTIISK